MIITTNIRWVISVRCDYKEDVTIVSLENVITGGFDELGVIHKIDNDEWPSYPEIRNTLVKRLRYNQTLSWIIAEMICHELRVPYKEHSEEIELPISTPLIAAVPQPGSLSDIQLRNVAKSACSSLQVCLDSQ